MTLSEPNAAIGIILGSAFHAQSFDDIELDPIDVPTRFGPQRVWQANTTNDRDAYVIFRHGLPHRLLPHHINWRAQAQALRDLGCQSVLVTSSVGVLDATIPLNCPMLVSDLIMLNNQLPDGSTCTMFPEPSEDHAHLVMQEGVFSEALGTQLEAIATQYDIELGPEVVFAYVPGPRTKTRAENRLWSMLGAHVNSMSLAPEVILANELGMSCAALVVGHKASSAQSDTLDVESSGAITRSLDASRAAMGTLIAACINHLRAVDFKNQLYRF